MRRMISVSLTLVGLLVPSLASAEEAAPDAVESPSPRGHIGLLAGGKVGGIVPFGGLSPNVTGGIELGYVFPWLKRSFAFAIDLDYAAPKSSGKVDDPRVTAGSYTWHLTQQELNLMPIVMYRLTLLQKITPYIGIGPRIYFLESTVRSDEGKPSFKETTEQSTKVGFGVPIGVEYALGPGALLGEILLQYGRLDHTATGVSNTGGLNLAFGYRVLL